MALTWGDGNKLTFCLTFYIIITWLRVYQLCLFLGSRKSKNLHTFTQTVTLHVSMWGAKRCRENKPDNTKCATCRTLGLSIPIPNALVATMTLAWPTTQPSH